MKWPGSVEEEICTHCNCSEEMKHDEALLLAGNGGKINLMEHSLISRMSGRAEQNLVAFLKLLMQLLQDNLTTVVMEEIPCELIIS